MKRYIIMVYITVRLLMCLCQACLMAVILADFDWLLLLLIQSQTFSGLRQCKAIWSYRSLFIVQLDFLCQRLACR